MSTAREGLWFENQLDFGPKLNKNRNKIACDCGLGPKLMKQVETRDCFNSQRKKNGEIKHVKASYIII